MNIYEKIQTIRVELKSKDIKMSGHNEYAKYDYFELDDFLAPLNELMQKYKMTAYPSFTPEFATLTVVNYEKIDEMFVIKSPMGSADLKGCHEVQNIGAVETYQRRYLYQALFDISEKDTLNGTQGKPEKKPTQESQKKEPPKPSQKQDKPQKTENTVEKKADEAKLNVLTLINAFIQTEQKKGKKPEGIINAFILGTNYEAKKQELTTYTLDKYGIKELDELTDEQLRDTLYSVNIKAGKIK